MRNLIQNKRSLVVITDREASRLNNVEQDDDAIIITVKEGWDAEERLAYAREWLAMWREHRAKS